MFKTLASCLRRSATRAYAKASHDSTTPVTNWPSLSQAASGTVFFLQGGSTVRALVLGVILSILAGTEALSDGPKGAQFNPSLKPWFDSLRSAKGLCCHDFDGVGVDDLDWDSNGEQFRVRIEGAWRTVPDDAVVTVPNRVGRTVVWFTKGDDGTITIRCFMPGVMT